MRLQPQMYHNGVMVTVDVRVDAVESLEKLLDCGLEVFGEGSADTAGEDGFVVDEGLGPGH